MMIKTTLTTAFLQPPRRSRDLGHNVFGLHWYIEADDAVWHFVTAATT